MAANQEMKRLPQCKSKRRKLEKKELKDGITHFYDSMLGC